LRIGKKEENNFKKEEKGNLVWNISFVFLAVVVPRENERHVKQKPDWFFTEENREKYSENPDHWPAGKLWSKRRGNNKGRHKRSIASEELWNFLFLGKVSRIISPFSNSTFSPTHSGNWISLLIFSLRFLFLFWSLEPTADWMLKN
jgi:hypothetical protein